jgi:hypothetical protein
MRLMTRIGAAWGLVIAAGAAIGGEIAVEDISTRRPILVANPTPGREAADPKLEASAVEAIGDGSLLIVADDKTPDLVVVESATGRQTGQKLSLGKLAEGPIAPKWEGMARDGDTYYVIGSHSGKKAAERLAHARLVRFKLSSTNPPAIEAGSVVALDLATSLAEVEGFRATNSAAASLGGASPSETSERVQAPAPIPADDPVKIEGLTVRPVAGGGREIVIGLRKPNDTIRAYAAALPEPSVSSEMPPLKLRRLFAFKDAPVGEVRRELGSLEYSPEWGGFFIVTLCEDEKNRFDENVLWFLPDDAIVKDAISTPTRVWTFARGFKCEGVAVVSSKGDSLDLILSFDNDAASTKMPSMIQAIRLKRSGR